MEPITDKGWRVIADAPALRIGEALYISLGVWPPNRSGGVPQSDGCGLLYSLLSNDYTNQQKARRREKLAATLGGEEVAGEAIARAASCRRWACVSVEGSFVTFTDRTLEQVGAESHFEYSWVKVADFAAFCVRQGWAIPERLAEFAPKADALAEPSDGRWPWGSHETELLRHLEAAARRYWVNYDPADITTAPTNADVKAFLMGRSVGDRAAEIMAQMLRADGLKPGPRPGGRTLKK